MSYAIYNPQTNKVLTWVTAPKGAIPEGWEFRPESGVPADAAAGSVDEGPPPVPQEVAMWALKELCLVRGHAVAIESALGSLPEPVRTIARNRWENKDTISRGSSIIAAMQSILGWTNSYVDELFIESAKL